jgi:hypothetical protein
VVLEDWHEELPDAQGWPGAGKHARGAGQAGPRLVRDEDEGHAVAPATHTGRSVALGHCRGWLGGHAAWPLLR